MRRMAGVVVAGMAIAAMAGLAGAQGMGMGMRSMPEMRGVWNPVVGAGGVYELIDKSGKKQMEFAIVGKENVQGAEGYWMEFSVETDRGGMVGKNLMVVDGENT